MRHEIVDFTRGYPNISWDRPPMAFGKVDADETDPWFVLTKMYMHFLQDRLFIN
jgi:hypothetical protein